MPEDALWRETVGCRATVKIWKALASYGVKIGAKHMSESLRGVLDSWVSGQEVSKASLSHLKDDALLREMDRRGYVGVRKTEMVEKLHDRAEDMRKMMEGMMEDFKRRPGNGKGA